MTAAAKIPHSIGHFDEKAERHQHCNRNTACRVRTAGLTLASKFRVRWIHPGTAPKAISMKTLRFALIFILSASASTAISLAEDLTELRPGAPFRDHAILQRGMPAADLTELKSWIPVADLKNAPSLRSDYEDLAGVRPGNPFHDANARRYVASWQSFWQKEIPAMISTRAVPGDNASGSFPTLSGEDSSDASQCYHVMVHSFTPAGLSGIIFLTSPRTVEQDEGRNFGEQMSVLANSWKRLFGGDEMRFLYTMPSVDLTPAITRPAGINGPSTAVELSDWTDLQALFEVIER